MSADTTTRGQDELTLAEASEYLDVSKPTLWRLVDRNQIESRRVQGRGKGKAVILIKRSVLDAFKANRGAIAFESLDGVVEAALEKQAAAFFWREWLPWEVAQLLYLKYQRYLRVLNSSARLEGATLVVLPADALPEAADPEDDQDVIQSCRDALGRKAAKLLVRPAFRGPYPASVEGEPLIGVRIFEQLEFPKSGGVIFLCRPGGEDVGFPTQMSLFIVPQDGDTGRSITVVRLWQLPLDDPTIAAQVSGQPSTDSLQDPRKYRELPFTGAWRQYLLDRLWPKVTKDPTSADPLSPAPEDMPSGATPEAQTRVEKLIQVAVGNDPDPERDFLQRAQEAWTLAQTIPIWMNPLLDYLSPNWRKKQHGVAEQRMIAAGQEYFSSASYPPIPPYPIAGADATVLRFSALKQFLELIEQTLASNSSDPKSIACQLFVPDEVGDELVVLAQSGNYGGRLVPRLRLDRGEHGLSGRAALREEQTVARYIAESIPQPLRDKRGRRGYDTRLVEAVATPIPGNGNVPAQRFGMWEVSSDRVRGILYVFTREPGLLQPSRLLWLRELAVLLSTYMAHGRSITRRDLLLHRDHAIGYRHILTALDAEKTQEFNRFLKELGQMALSVRPDPISEVEREERPPDSSLLTPGITFIYLDVNGVNADSDGQPYPTTVPELSQLRQRYTLDLLTATRQRIAMLQQHPGFGLIDFAVAPYQHGVLVALQLGPKQTTHETLRRLQRRCYRFLLRFGASHRQVDQPLPLSGIVIHHSWSGDFVNSLWNAAGGATVSEKASLNRQQITQQQQAKLELAIRGIDNDLTMLRRRVTERREQVSQPKEHKRGYHPLVYYINWDYPEYWEEQSSTAPSR